MELILAQRCVPDARDSNSAIHVNAAMQYISDNFSDSELTALAVSKAIVIAPKYLSRIFKQQTGTDLGRYITNRRLSAATELMQKCEYSLAEISRMCGFASPYYFSVVFKKYNKITRLWRLKNTKTNLGDNFFLNQIHSLSSVIVYPIYPRVFSAISFTETFSYPLRVLINVSFI